MADEAVTAERVTRPKARWLGIACVALLVATGATAVFLRSRSEQPVVFCAGVGLAATESLPSPEIAFAEWLATRPEQPPIEKWKRTEDRSIAVTHDPDSVVFKNAKHNGGYVGGYAVVTLRQGGTNFNTGGLFPSDEWSVDGACVGRPPNP